MLAIVKKLVEAHGGKIELRNEYERGATVALSLPL